MNTKFPLSVLILTYNEELNLPTALRSVHEWVSRICVVDSFSTDKTLDIAKEYGCDVLQHPFSCHADQVNWALEHCRFDTDWIMRLDADERVTPALRETLIERLPAFEKSVAGVTVKRKIYFMDSWIKHGCYYSVLRIWRSGNALCEKRQMDEHMKLVSGRCAHLNEAIIDQDQHNLTSWVAKHNSYATREALDRLRRAASNLQPEETDLPGRGAKRRRWLKEKLYYSAPPFLRAFVYFTYRYIFLLGFLDGIPGLIWHFSQAFWYRFLVDSKILEVKRVASSKKIPISEAVELVLNRGR